MKSLTLLLIFSASFFIRALRWLAVVQQKEYRLDRLFLFFKTKEGKNEIFRLLPQKKDFSRTGLKRPKITLRIIFTSVIFIAMFIFLVINLIKYTFILDSLIFILSLLTGLIIFLAIIPLLVIISIFPTHLISTIKIYFELLRASKKVKKLNPIIVGITGSYGKTSTKLLLASVLEKKYSVFKTPKSFNTKYSVAHSINQKFTGQEIMILEYGAYKKGEIKTLAKWFKPTMAIITGLTKQHLGLFGNINAIINAKSELVKALRPGSVVIRNGNDVGTDKIVKAGIGPDSLAQGNLKIIETENATQNSVILKTHLNKVGKLVFVFAGQQITSNLLGFHYLDVVKMVISASQSLAMTDEEIVTGISEFIPDDNFIYSYKLKSGSLVIDDGGTSNPKGFEAAISLASSFELSKKILITGGIVDLGEESNEIHFNLATMAKKVFENVLYVGESGKDQFSSIFESRYLGVESQEDQKKVIEFLSKLDNHEMILIEGRMPGWITNYLK